MSELNSLIQADADGALSFGNYMLKAKEKVDNFENCGNIYKVKTFSEMTRLERNGMFVYESVPGTEVSDFRAEDSGMYMTIEGAEDAQITVGLAEETEYRVYIDDVSVGKMCTNLGGKLSLNVELEPDRKVCVKITR